MVYMDFSPEWLSEEKRLEAQYIEASKKLRKTYQNLHDRNGSSDEVRQAFLEERAAFEDLEAHKVPFVQFMEEHK